MSGRRSNLKGDERRVGVLVAKDASGMVWFLDVQIVSALTGLGVAHRNKIEKYKGNSSLVDDLASGRARSGPRPSHSRGRECGGIKR